MGGDISFQTSLGQGTTFSFEVKLPLSAVEEAVQQTRRVIGLMPGQRKFRILIVDDIWENRALLIKLLSPLGVELREAANGKEAFEQWSDWRPDLIWMDMRMPVMDGYAATKLIRQSEAVLIAKLHDEPATSAQTRVVIIALSASAFEHDREAILAIGCDDFLAKPFREAVIFEEMAKYLGLQYLYEEEPPSSRGTERETEQTALTPSRLAALPCELKDPLARAMALGDLEEVQQVVDKIAQTDEELARGIRKMVKNYQVEELLELIATMTK